MLSIPAFGSSSHAHAGVHCGTLVPNSTKISEACDDAARPPDEFFLNALVIVPARTPHDPYLYRFVAQKFRLSAQMEEPEEVARVIRSAAANEPEKK